MKTNSDIMTLEQFKEKHYGTNPITGMLVYNTGGTLGAGIYYWDGSKWQTVENTAPTYTGSTSVPLNGNSFERAALTGDVTAPANSNLTTINDGAVTTAKLANGAVGLQQMKFIETEIYLGITPPLACVDTVVAALAGTDHFDCIYNFRDGTLGYVSVLPGGALRICNHFNAETNVNLRVACFRP